MNRRGPRAIGSRTRRSRPLINQTYHQVLKKGYFDWGTVTKDGVREAERKWPAYRDAWADFSKTKFTKTDPVAVKTWLTRERTDMLNEFAPQDPVPAN